MEPEKGAKLVQVTRQDVAEAARSTGIAPGDVMIFHSSLSSMGTVVGGPDTIIDGFLDAVGPEGTVAAPTLCNWTPEAQKDVFPKWDPAATPSYVGRITEVFRQRPDAVRSNHPTHSVAAIGARAQELTAGHGDGGLRPGPYGSGAFAASSPWQKLYEWNAAYGFIGVTFRVCTMVHFVETLLLVRALERAPADLRPALADEVSGWMKPGAWLSIRIEQRDTFEAYLAGLGKVAYGKLGSATFRVARARDIVDYWIARVEATPAEWLSEQAVTWLVHAQAQAQ